MPIHLRNLSILPFCAVMAACSDGGTNVVEKPDVVIADPVPALSITPDNIFDADYFKEQNVLAQQDGIANSYIDDEAGDFEVLDMGTYTSDARQSLKVCVQMTPGESFPALRFTGKQPKFTMTSVLNVNTNKVILDENGLTGMSEVSDGMLCLTTQALPANSTVKVMFFPAMSKVEEKNQKAATGSVKINDVTVSWVDS